MLSRLPPRRRLGPGCGIQGREGACCGGESHLTREIGVVIRSLCEPADPDGAVHSDIDNIQVKSLAIPKIKNGFGRSAIRNEQFDRTVGLALFSNHDCYVAFHLSPSQANDRTGRGIVKPEPCLETIAAAFDTLAAADLRIQDDLVISRLPA